MKTKILILSLALLAFCAAGCNRSGPETIVSVEPPSKPIVTTVDEFRSTFEQWAGHLSDMADSTTSAYASWAEGQSSKEEFVATTQQIYEQMKQLKKQSDLQAEFHLTEADRQAVNYSSVLNAYDNAKKNLNDFLYLVPQSSEEEIKTMYENKVQTNFNENLNELKKQLLPPGD